MSSMYLTEPSTVGAQMSAEATARLPSVFPTTRRVSSDSAIYRATSSQHGSPLLMSSSHHSRVAILRGTAASPQDDNVQQNSAEVTGIDDLLDPGNAELSSVGQKGKSRAIGERPMDSRQQTGRLKAIRPDRLSGGFLTPYMADISVRQGSRPSLSRLQDVQTSNIGLLAPQMSELLAAAAHTTRSGLSANGAPALGKDGLQSSATSATVYATRENGMSAHSGMEIHAVEIPRFKTRELNLGIVRSSGPWQRFTWLILWFSWIVNGLSSVFFDVNILYMTIQCVIHSSTDDHANRSWAFAAVAYAICSGLSTFLVWCGWEVYYEFWRRWGTARPAIEPIHLSLPATLHLALISYPHFTFLLYVRSSPLGTPFAFDIIPETAYSLAQLGPGLLPLLPRAAIASVLLISFSTPPAQSTPFGAINQSRVRDPHFFDAYSQLTTYARGVLIAFISLVMFRLLVVLGSIAILCLTSVHTCLGSMRQRAQLTKSPRTTLRESRRTVSRYMTPLERESNFYWSWKLRTRERIQDAFELCMIRRGEPLRGSYLRSQDEVATHGRSSPLIDPATIPATVACQCPPSLEAGRHLRMHTNHVADQNRSQRLMHRPQQLLTSAHVQQRPEMEDAVAVELVSSFRLPPVPTIDSSGTSHDKRQQVSSGDECSKSDDDDSTALLGNSTTSKSSLQTIGDRISSTGSRMSSAVGQVLGPQPSKVLNIGAGHELTKGRGSPRGSSEGTLSRARSTSVTVLRESVRNAAVASSSIVRRARSGTMLTQAAGYSPVMKDVAGD